MIIENKQITNIKNENLKFEYTIGHGETMLNITDVSSVTGEFHKEIRLSNFRSLENFIHKVDKQRIKLKHGIFFFDGEFYTAKFKIEEPRKFKGKNILNSHSNSYKFIWRYEVIE